MNQKARWPLALALVLSFKSLSTNGRAVDKQACFTAFDSSLELRKAGRLTAAHEQMKICADGDCPSITVSKCSEWLDELVKQIPTVVIVAKGVGGDDTTEVVVSIDGKKVADELDGRPIPLDPGAHTITLAHGEAEPITRQLVLAEGEQNRKLNADFSKPGGDEASTAPSTGPSPLIYVGFAVAGAGLVAGAITGGLSLAKASDLREACKDNHCNDDLKSDYDNGQLLAHISTASFAVAGAGAIVGVIGLFLPTAASEDDKADARRIQLEPQIGFGSIGLSGRF